MSEKKMGMSFLAEPNDANYKGNVHGGKVMKWIDEIGYALSVKYTKKYCVTKFVDDIEFLKPINIGDLVKLDAEIIKVGVSSLRIKIIVNSENLIKNSLKKNCECFIVFVAIDENGNKIKINN
jgi:acyl-CoA hydrolase